jgi:hypothetical protein
VKTQTFGAKGKIIAAIKYSLLIDTSILVQSVKEEPPTV